MRPSSKLRVLLAEGDSLFRQGLRRILEGQEWIQIVGETDNGRLAVEMLGQLQPDVLILEGLSRSALGDVRIVYPGPMDVVPRSQRDERPKLFLRSALPSCRSAV